MIMAIRYTILERQKALNSKMISKLSNLLNIEDLNRYGNSSKNKEIYRSFAIKIVFSVHYCKSYSNYLRDGPNALPLLP